MAPSKAGLNQSVDTGARDTPAINRKQQKALPAKVATKYVKAKRTRFN